jgi:prepilin-type N-terminal cleavage/methylation domain-containing protein
MNTFRMRRSQKGDTLVEVLISIALVGLVLATSYGTASRSVRIGREAQERAEATRIAESQVEQVKASAKGKKLSEFPFVTTDFCFDTSARQGSAGTPACERSELYKIVVKFEPRTSALTDNPDDRFTVKVLWAPLGSGPQQESTLYYKIHPEL